ncbi:MAG: DUF2064 domain-containing protein [Deltaproteobacteria bacterium]|nr:DUF2064 domain-containing protein [Deltaproteobacteria bacterium]
MTNDNRSGAIAIFVKTPGLSPIKTRLAETIGKSAAQDFYRLSVAATRAQVRKLVEYDPTLTPYWAIAELDALNHEMWSGCAQVAQGEGNLGQRLAHVYNEVLKQHSFVLLVGADAPHLPYANLISAAESLRQKDHPPDDVPSFVLGRCDDGGFYVIGGNISIPVSVWLEVPYSATDTADKMRDALCRFGAVAELPQSFDIDTEGDLKKLAQITFNEQTLLPEQLAVYRWAKYQIGSRAGALAE